ncbi:MAG: mannitol dehydrogenase family protein [Cellulomonadaceae bacterium]
MHSAGADWLETVHRSGRGVSLPGYDRGAITPGIVHFGVGGFHRAHQAVALDRLMEAGQAMDWGIVGAGVLPGDARMRDALQAQDGAYTLLVKHPDGHREARVIGSIVGFLYGPDDPEALLDQMTSAATRIVSLTITEGGYEIDRVTGEFAPSPEVLADAERADSAPTTAFGYIVEALARRRAAGTAPFTVMSCDNIQENGHVTKGSLTAFARLRDPELADWITEHVAFPSSMVDRITPVTTEADRATLLADFGVSDAWPVVAEPFFQWALEDAFTLGRPPYEAAGVQIVPDVRPYEFMKLRLLNASHQGMCYFGTLMGYTYAHEAASDPLIETLLRRYMDREATPTLPEVPGIDLRDYKDTLIERFQNPEIADTLARLCAYSSDRIPKWLVPVVVDQLALADPHVELSAAIIASWARYAEGRDEHGEPIDVVDLAADRVRQVAATQGLDSDVFLRIRDFFGDLADDERVAEPYRSTLASLHERGARRTLETVLGV